MEDTNLEAASIVGFGPGAMLHQARSDLRMPIEDVARALNLASRHIESLESDRYDQLPAPAYVRGYLRGYAQLLGLSVQTVLDLYNRLPVASQQIDLTAPVPMQQLSSDHRVVKLVTVLVAFVVIGMATVWWQGQTSSVADRPAGATEPGPGTTVAPITAAPPPPVAPAPADTLPTESAPSPPAGEVASPSPPSAPTATPSPAPTTLANSAPVADNVAGNTPALAVRPQARITLYVHDESWADVRDADDNKLLYTLVAAGRVVTLMGVAPFNVFLGNADGVKVEFNGNEFNTEPHKRGPIARFTLGASTP